MCLVSRIYCGNLLLNIFLSKKVLVSSNWIFHIRNWFKSFEVMKFSREERRCILKIKYPADFWKHLDGLFSFTSCFLSWFQTILIKALIFQCRLNDTIQVNKWNIESAASFWFKPVVAPLVNWIEMFISFKYNNLIGQFRITV